MKGFLGVLMCLCGESPQDPRCELELTRRALWHVKTPQTLSVLHAADHAHFNHRATSSKPAW